MSACQSASIEGRRCDRCSIGPFYSARSDKGPWLLAMAVRDWIVLSALGPPMSRQPLGELHVESFNARIRDELLDGEIFYTYAQGRADRDRSLAD